jgi:hypothetical protein
LGNCKLYETDAPGLSLAMNGTDELAAKEWDDHGLFKDDPAALKLFDDIGEERDRHLTGSE